MTKSTLAAKMMENRMARQTSECVKHIYIFQFCLWLRTTVQHLKIVIVAIHQCDGDFDRSLRIEKRTRVRKELHLFGD